MIVEPAKGQAIPLQGGDVLCLSEHYDIIVLSGTNWNVTGSGQRPVQLTLEWAAMGFSILFVEMWVKEATPAVNTPPNVTIANINSDAVIAETLSCKLLYIGFPSEWFVNFARRCKAKHIHYDCMDSWQAFALECATPFDITWENEAIALANSITVTSRTLAAEMKRRSHGKEVVLCPNAAKEDIFRPLRSITKRKKAVYVGTLAPQWKWVCIDAVAAVANAHPDWEFVIVGGVPRLRMPPNVTAYDTVPHDRIVHYMHGGKIGIIPFNRCGCAHHANPIKAWEYLAAGMVIAATNVPDLDDFPNTICVHDDDAVRGLLTAFEVATKMNYSELSDEFWQRNSWKSRAKTILDMAGMVSEGS